MNKIYNTMINFLPEVAVVSIQERSLSIILFFSCFNIDSSYSSCNIGVVHPSLKTVMKPDQLLLFSNCFWRNVNDIFSFSDFFSRVRIDVSQVVHVTFPPRCYELLSFYQHTYQLIGQI